MSLMQKGQSNANFIIKMSSILILVTMTLFLENAKADPLKEAMKEYCEWEAFNATCKEYEIIMIKSAVYGRMNLGRCVTRDFGNIGCGTEVTSYLDGQCSGKRHCLVQIISLHGKSICSSDLKLYLEASYECVKAGSDSVTTCPPEGYITMTSASGQIASSVVHETNIGGSKCPLRVKVAPYQRLNITMIDFSVPLPSDRWYQVEHYEPFPVICDQSSGFIVDRYGAQPSRNISLCAGMSSGGHPRKRTTAVYKSRGNVVDIVIYADIDNIFLVMYHAIGCPPIQPPLYASVQRNGDMAVVSCNNSQRTWYLTCSGTEWAGTFTNCTKPIVDGGTGILMVVALGIAIGVAIGVLLLTVVLAYLKGRRMRNARSRSSNYILKASESEYEEGLRNHTKCTSLTDSSSLLTKRDDQYSCPSMIHGSCTTIEPSTLQLKHISPARDDHVIMTSLPDPPTMTPPPLPCEVDLSRSSTSRSNSAKKKKKDKTMDYKWDSLSINENEINELSNLRENLRIPRERNPFSISFSERCKSRVVDEPYYFKFDGIVGYKVDRDTQRPDIVPAACTACNYNSTS